MAFKDNFRGDSAYTQIMTKIFNIFWLSILWLLCCIPVLTIGASTIALYYVLLKLVKDEETTVTREFFHSFKQNFLQSLPVTVIVLVVVVVLVADFHILGAAGRAQGASFMYGFCIVLGIICAAVFSYVFPLLAKFENTVKKTFENGARLAGQPHRTDSCDHSCESFSCALVSDLSADLFRDLLDLGICGRRCAGICEFAVSGEDL